MPRKNKKNKNTISAEEVIRQNKALAEERQHKADEEMANFDYDDDRFQAADEEEKLEKMQQYMLLGVAGSIDTGKEESFQNSVNSPEVEQVLIRIANVFPWTACINILLDPNLIKFAFGDLVEGSLGKAEARDAFIKDVLEPEEQKQKKEPEIEEPGDDEPLIADVPQEGQYMTEEEKNRKTECESIFNDQNRFEALSVDEKKALFREYSILRAKFSFSYNPDMESRLQKELEESKAYVDKAFDLLANNVQSGKYCLDELNQVCVQFICFGNTFIGWDDAEKQRELQQLEEDKIRQWKSIEAAERAKAKRDEKKKNVGNIGPVELVGKDKLEIPDLPNIDIIPDNIGGGINEPEDEPEKAAKELDDTKSIGRSEFSLEEANNEADMLFGQIKKVDYNLMGKGSQEFRDMKASLEYLSALPKVDYHNGGELNLDNYCVAQSDAIHKIEEYLKHKQVQMDAEPGRLEDPKRQKREQPRIHAAVKILNYLKHSYEQNREILSRKHQEKFREEAAKKWESKLSDSLRSAKNDIQYMGAVLEAVDYAGHLDGRNLSIRQNETVTEYNERLNDMFSEIGKKDSHKLLSEFNANDKGTNPSIVKDAVRRFKGGEFTNLSGEKVQYPGKQKIGLNWIMNARTEVDKGYTKYAKPYYTEKLAYDIDRHTKSYEKKLFSSVTRDKIREADRKAAEKKMAAEQKKLEKIKASEKKKNSTKKISKPKVLAP